MLASSAVKLSPISPPRASDLVFFSDEEPQEWIYSPYNSTRSNRNEEKILKMSANQSEPSIMNTTFAIWNKTYSVVDYYSELLVCLENLVISKVS